MKKQTYMLFIILMLPFGCQKDFYLNDLNEVNSQIEALRSQIEVSENEGKLLMSDKESIQVQIDEIQNQLEQQLMSLDEALEKISELEDRVTELNETDESFEQISELVEKISELEVIKDGIYEVVLEKRISTTEEGIENREPWWKSDPMSSEFFRIQGGEIVNHTALRNYAIAKGSEGNKYDWLDTRKLESSPYYSDLSLVDTTDQNLYYKVNLSMERISLDSLLIIDQERTTLNYYEDDIFNSEMITVKLYKKLVERKNFPLSVKTEDELTEIFKNTRNGFYSDPLYLTLDPSDPYDYIRVFIADAKRHGLDLKHIMNKEPYLKKIPIRDLYVCAWASDVCDREKIWIEYDSNCWEDGFPSPYFADRLQTMYHELGHTILSYDHPMVEDWEEKGLEWPENVAEGFNNRKI